MRIMIVGQQWLGMQALKLCLRRGDEVVKVLAPGADEGEEHDRLYAAAMQAGVPVQICAKRVEAAHIPANTDLILAAHAHPLRRMARTLSASISNPLPSYLGAFGELADAGAASVPLWRQPSESIQKSRGSFFCSVALAVADAAPSVSPCGSATEAPLVPLYWGSGMTPLA